MLGNLKLAAVALGLVLFASSGSTRADDDSDDKFDLRTSFATKTAYWDQESEGHESAIKNFIQVLDKEDSDKYTLLQVQHVVRHGARFPTESNTEEIIDLLGKLQTKYAQVIPSWLKAYSLPYNLTVEGLLAPAGATELEGLGKRARKSVGGFSSSSSFPATFSSDKFVLQHTYKPRTKFSAIAFASTFFSNPQDVKYIEYSKKNDPLLRFYDQCPRYERDVKENKNATLQLELYKQSKRMLKTIDTLKAKLDLPQDADITVTDVEAAFSACAFDLALYDTKNNWCTLLTEELIKTVEYAEDLEAYYEESHGNKLNYEMASVLLKDIVKFMTDFVDGKTNVVGNFRFAHGETTLPLMTLLGYADPSRLLASASEGDIEDRGFRTSTLAPFAANLEFRLYKKNKNGKHYVQIRVNEQVTEVPGCDNGIFCKLSEVQDLWGYYLSEYDFEEDCKI